METGLPVPLVPISKELNVLLTELAICTLPHSFSSVNLAALFLLIGFNVAKMLEIDEDVSISLYSMYLWR